MADLIAQGPQPQDRWRKRLNASQIPLELGRGECRFSTPWDDRISRRHALLRWDGRTLVVERLAEARNPIFWRGGRADQLKLQVGDHFVIGQTTFSLVEQRVRVVAPESIHAAEHSFEPSTLKQIRYRDADRRIDVLARLPDLIRGATSDQELLSRLVNLLMIGIEPARFIAIIRSSMDGPPAASDTIRIEDQTPTASDGKSLGIDILHWDSRLLTGAQFSPSASLIRQAIESEQSILHVWGMPIEQLDSHSTQSEQVDWAFCTPIASDACPGWAVYVAGDYGVIPGALPSESTSRIARELQEELKFAELVATTLAALRQNRYLQRRQDCLRSFFSPVVMEALAGSDPEVVLAPKESCVSILFCDLRGFSRESEQATGRLRELLERVSEALGVMTRHILRTGGVIGDFHGDAAMGFWGWPLATQQDALRALEAALAIAGDFHGDAMKDSRMHGFQVGIGIASGNAVAGRIGSSDQVKVTAFGPVVNRAARLEGITKMIPAPMLIDHATAEAVAPFQTSMGFRLREIASLLPYGMSQPIQAFEVIPTAHRDIDRLHNDLLAYANGLEAFQQGRWKEARDCLEPLQTRDQAAGFLLRHLFDQAAPHPWDGIIRLDKK